MTNFADAAAGDSRTDAPYDISPGATRRRDDRIAALSFLDAAIARLDAAAATQARAPSGGEGRKGGTP